MPNWLRPYPFALLLCLTALPAIAAESSGDKEPSLFATDPFSYVWNLLMFLILLAVLWVFVWPKVLEGLQAREEKQRSDLTAAEKARVDAEAALAEYKAKITEAQKEAQKVVEEARQSAEQVAAKVKADTESDIVKLKQRAEAEITAAKEQAVSEMHAHMAELSTQIAGKILKREISSSDQQSLVSESLAELSKGGV